MFHIIPHSWTGIPDRASLDNYLGRDDASHPIADASYLELT
jgi:hypothetical protein